MTDKKDKPRKGCIRRLFGFGWGVFKFTVTCCLLAAVGYVVWVNYAGKQALKRFEAELLKRQIPLAFEDEKQIPDEVNAARYWQAAMKMVVRPDYRAFDELNWPDFGERFMPDVTALLAKQCQQNQAVFPLIKNARSHDQCFYQINAIENLDQYMRFLGQQRPLIYVLKHHVDYATAKGDKQKAVDICLDLLAFVDSGKQTDSWFYQYVRQTHVAIAISQIEELMARVESTPSQILELKQAMNTQMILDLPKILRGDFRDKYQRMARPDWYLLQQEYQRGLASYKLSFTAPRYEFTGWEGKPGLELVMPIQKWYEWLLECAINCSNDLCGGAYQMIDEKTAAQGFEVYDLLLQPDVSWEHLKEIKKIGDNYGDNLFLRTGRTQIIVAMAALSIEQYRMTHGDWPSSLDQVFDEDPVDTYEQSLKIVKCDDGVLVYSCGPNGIDDQGIWHKSEDESQSKDDVAFRLLDPSQRNREPEPKPKPETEISTGAPQLPANLFEDVPHGNCLSATDP